MAALFFCRDTDDGHGTPMAAVVDAGRQPYNRQAWRQVSFVEHSTTPPVGDRCRYRRDRAGIPLVIVHAARRDSDGMKSGIRR
jgi:hypothetical protein